MSLNQLKEVFLKGAEYIKSVENNDIYYDTDDWGLFRDNIYLRKRSGKFELKMPIIGFEQNTRGMSTRVYNEIDDEVKIKKILNIVDERALREILPNAEYDVLAEYTVAREKYQKGEFTIDVDSTSFGYEMVEIELMIESADQVKAAEQRIEDFAKSNNLDNTPKRGKLEEYLLKKYPKRFVKYIKSD